MSHQPPIHQHATRRCRRRQARCAESAFVTGGGLESLEPRMMLSAGAAGRPPGAAPSLFSSALQAAASTAQVNATVETAPVPGLTDEADDPAIWVHPTDPALSLVIGTDKGDDGGLILYNLNGSQRQFLRDGWFNNVDLRYNFPLDGGPIDLVAVSDRTNNTIALYRVDVATRTLVDVAGTPIDLGAGFEPYGLALYRSPATGKVYAFTNNSEGGGGTVEQIELSDNGAGGVEGTIVRSFNVGSLSEGLAADDVHASLYVSEEDVALWLYGAEPSAGDTRIAIDTTGAGGHLAADIEGLTIYYRGDGQGYLIASSQGDSTFAVYDTTGDHAFIKSFAIAADVVDAVTETDGIDVTNLPLGPAFAHGAFIAHDTANSDPDANQNYKLVPWESLANAGGAAMTIDSPFDPRGDLINLDVDGDGRADALTDGLLIARYLSGYRGAALVSDAVAPGAARTSATAIEALLAAAAPVMLDADGNAGADAATDAVLIARWLFGFSGAALADAAIGSGATRTTPAAIETFIGAWAPTVIDTSPGPAAPAPPATAAPPPPAAVAHERPFTFTPRSIAPSNTSALPWLKRVAVAVDAPVLPRWLAVAAAVHRDDAAHTFRFE